MAEFLVVIDDGMTNSERNRLDEILDDIISVNREKVEVLPITSAREYILENTPHVICLMGGNAHKLFHKGAISKVRGKLLPRDSGGYTLTTYALGYIEYNPDSLPVLCNDLYDAYCQAVGIVLDDKRTHTTICKTIDDVEDLISHILTTGECSFDIETNNINELRGAADPDLYITCISFSFQHGSSWVVPLWHKENKYFTPDECTEILEQIGREILENEAILKIAHNINFEAHVFTNYGIQFKGIVSDTMLMHSLIDETKRHGLKELVSEYLPDFAGYELDLPAGTKFEDIPLPTLMKYNAIDSDVTFRLHTQFELELLQDKRSYVIYRNLVMPAWKALFQAEVNGALIDKTFLRNTLKTSEKYLKESDKKLRNFKEVLRYELSVQNEAREQAITETENKLYAWQATHSNPTKTEEKLKQKLSDLKTGKINAKKPLNFNSPKQMQDLLYFHPDGFRFMPLEGTSTGKDIISSLPDDSGFIEEFLNMKSMSKIQSTYLKGLLDRLSPENRVHTQFLLHGTKSGRLSSRNPNLQNIPNLSRLKDERTIELVSSVRKCFIPQEGNYLYQLDFSQMELRLMAEFSQDEVMIDAYVNGRDIHAITASKVLKISLDEFYALDPKKQKEYRTQAKAVNFGFCMAGDTKVPTKDGLVRLDSIKVGQEVLTAFGNWGEVTQTFKRTVDTTLEITTRGGKTVIVTPEHMMLVYFPAANGLKGKHGWVEARRLDVGDYLTFVNAERHHAEVDLWANDLARIAGWYLAEGCRHNSGIKITQSFQANSDVYGEMNRVLPKYGFTPFTDLTGFYIKAENFKVLEKMLHVNFDNHSKDKILDIPIERLSYNDKINLLAGLWDGDGCVTTSNHRLTISYSSISISLLEYIKEVLETLGINSKIYDYKKSNGAIQLHIMGTESRKIFWEKIPTIKLNRIPPYNPKKSFDATEKIVSIKELKENIEVFDITVKGDHSFIANGLASHNCYGMGAYAYVGYSKNTYGIEVSLEAAENMRNAFFDTYKRLPDYHAEYVQKASKYGWVRTLFGRRRRTPDINSDDGMRSSMDERVSINSPIQGTGGEITLFVIALLQHRLDPRVKLVNTVHDSIMYDVPPELLDETVRICTETCENAPMLMYFGRELKKVTLKIDSEVSTTNWRELRPYEINQK